MEETSQQWLSMPPEIWLKVFEFIPKHELFGQVARTCNLFKVYARDSSLWKYLDLAEFSSFLFEEDSSKSKLCYFEIFLKGLISYNNIHEKLISLKFSRYTQCSTEAVLRLVSKFKNLKELDVGFCDEIDTTTLKQICCDLTMLKSLNLEGCKNITDSSLECLQYLKCLQKLSISHCSVLTNTVCTKYLKNLPITFISFNCDGVINITDFGIISLMKTHPQMQELTLDGEYLTDRVCTFAAENLKLKVFKISFAENITEVGIAAISKFNLKELKLRKLKNKISSIYLTKLFANNTTDSFSSLKRITITDLEEFDDNCMAVIGKTCNQLQFLHIDWCWEVTDAGIEPVISNCNKINTLSLVGLFRLSGKWLKGIELKLPYLKFLDMSECHNINDTELVAFAKRVPYAAVYTYYREKIDPKLDISYYVPAIDTPVKPIKCAGEMGFEVDF